MAREDDVASAENHTLKKQASQKEKQLHEARKQRKEKDDQLQAMLNRIGYLQSEEAKIDRDIENARNKARDMLSRKAEKAEKLNDQDVAATAKEIIGTISTPPPASKPLRPVTGRSSLQASIASSGSLAASVQLAASAAAPAAPVAQPTAVSISSPRVTSPSTSARPASRQRAPSAARARDPSTSATRAQAAPSASTHNTAAAAVPPRGHSAVRSSGGGSRASSASPTPCPPSTSAPPSAPSSSQGHCAKDKHTATATTASSNSSKQHAEDAPGPSAAAAAHKAQHAGEDVLEDVAGSGAQGRHSGRVGVNRMELLSGTGHGDADLDLIEELLSGSGANDKGEEQQLQGLQQFSSQVASRTVQVRATTTKRQDSHSGASASGGPSAVVLAAGVGWGLGGPSRDTAGAASAMQPALMPPVGVLSGDKEEAARLQKEMAKKRQLWSVRKAFGLHATPQGDASAQVVECGAGAWQ
mmetsp:Transcript_20577/g.45043  ORF Transcript_20577/g.45043 Transcript_20577/m.45043 type:complete len:472 (-) Transcript_20577:196-1611(-)|eukprot:CAMPEP_0202906222 /NCGR_PEP_ID=MMETSP1392-20130828/37829_1 /ASSEMBLY_ACC=CAM_ASM_000868 /TAXON_ID=225041 /ORGANISM="Chlamydomonas chlamydogama, Strain SAG 11-48b" /LENGTH=471 /DNA_ID=CAMNT_0049594619 /DNA_START=119 /DNA_END=1534 /DNA_ORIENTATION=+